MSGYSYSICRQCRNATVAVANNSSLLSHARTRNCLCYSLLSVSRYLSTLAVVSMYNFSSLNQLFPRLSLCASEKSFPYCNRRNATFCQYVMLIDSHLPTLYYCYCIQPTSLWRDLSCSQTPGKPHGGLSTQIKHFPPSWTSKLLASLIIHICLNIQLVHRIL